MIAVFVRSDVQWHNITIRNYAQQTGTAGMITPASRRRYLECAKLWADTFRMSVFDYRAALRDIATTAIDRIEGLDAVFRNYATLARAKPENDNAWILPIDDDDWFSPSIADYCRDHDANATHMLTWAHVRLSADNARFQYPQENVPFVLTNQYAISNSAMTILNRDSRKTVLSHHGMAWQTIQRTAKRSFRDIRTKSPLAVTLKSPASYTQLTQFHNPEELLEFVTRGDRLFAEEKLLPKWAKPHAAKVGQLLGELIESRK